MSSNETTDNNENVMIEEIDESTYRHVPNDNEHQVGNGSNAPTAYSFGGSTSRDSTTSSIGVTGFGGLPSNTAPGCFGGPPPSSIPSAFGGQRPATTGASSSQGFGLGFGLRQGPAPNPSPFSIPGLNPATAPLPSSMAFGFCGGPPRPVERHPETGQPINHPAHHMPHSACGGVQPPVSQVFGTTFVGGNDKKKNIDTIYSKLAQARAKIAELNKFLDDIYETLPKIQ